MYSGTALYIQGVCQLTMMETHFMMLPAAIAALGAYTAGVLLPLMDASRASTLQRFAAVLPACCLCLATPAMVPYVSEHVQRHLSFDMRRF